MKKIFLLADDDLDDQQLLTEAMHMADPEVVLATSSSVKEAIHFLQQLRDELPRLLIVDYNMPDQNGEDLLDAVKKDPRWCGIPIVVWSTSDSSHYQAVCLRKGAKKYYRKPERFSELVELARRLLTDASPDQ